MSLGDRIEKMRTAAPDKRAAERAAEVERWKALKAEHPDVCGWIEDMSRVFGKPSGVAFKARGGESIILKPFPKDERKLAPAVTTPPRRGR